MVELLDHLWQSTLFAAVVALLALALRQNGAHVRYWLWLAASIKFLVPFSLLIALGSQFQWGTVEAPARPGFDLSSEWADLAVTVVQPAGEAFVDARPATLPEVGRSSLDVQLIATIVWACGFLCVLGICAIRWLRIQRSLRNAVPLKVGPTGRPLEFPVPIVSVPEQLEPGILGIWRPHLLLPQSLYERLSPVQLRAILAHELCHLQRRDNLTAAVHMFVEAVFWFHPLVWWIGARLLEERERACDAAVLNAGNDPEAYAEGILDVCQHYMATPLKCVAGVSGADLKKRIRAIMLHTGEARLQLGKVALIGSVALSIIGAPIAVGALTATRAASDPAANREWPEIQSLRISISEAKVGGPTDLLINPNGSFTTRNKSLRGIIGFAYDLQEGEILETDAFANHLASTRYNINAKMAASGPDKAATESELRRLVQRILAEQFGLRFHWTEQRSPVYELRSTGASKGMRLAAEDDPGPLLNRGFNSVTGYAVPMRLFNQYLGSRFNRPIVDNTGLTGQYNFKLSWDIEPTRDHAATDLASAPEPSIDTLVLALETQLGLIVTSTEAKVRRMVIDGVSQAANLKPLPVQISVPNDVFDRHVGYYDFPPGRIITVFRAGDRLYTQLTGQPSLEIFATAPDRYYSKEAGAEFVFTVNGATTTEVVLEQNGGTFLATRIPAAEANARQARLAERIREKIALPDSEQKLRQYFASLKVDDPAYHLMTKEVAAGVRRDWPGAKARFARIGAVKSIEFTGVGPAGADIYRVNFEHSTSEWRIGMNADGKIDVLTYRRIVL